MKIDSNELASVLEQFDGSVFGRALELLIDIAEGRAKVVRVPNDLWESDPLLTPTQAAKELGIGWQTLRNKWGPKYGIKHSGHTGKGRRYRASEIDRVKNLFLGDSAETMG